MNNSNKIVKVEITSKTILFTIAVVISLFFLNTLGGLFVNLFIAFILMSALRPIVDFLDKNRIPRSLASILVILLSLTLITTLFAFAIPPLVSQTVEFISFFSKQLVTTFSQIDTNINPADFINVNTLTQQIPNITTLVSNIVLGFFGNILNILSIFFFTLYFLMGIEKLEVFATKFLNKNQQTFFSETLKNVEKQLGAWMRAEILLMFVIGLLSYFGLVALGVKYALPLAVIAGLFEIFPIVGPIISVFPAFFVAASSSWVLSLLVIGLYIIIQQLENNLIVPYVMKKAVGIPPLAVLIALFIGQRVAGVWGIVLAVPITATLIIIVKEVFLYRQSTTE